MRRDAGAFIVLAIAASLAMLSCTFTKLTSVWKDDSYRGGQMRKVLVVGVSDNPSDKKKLENEFAERFKSFGIEAVPAYAAFPSAAKDGRPDRQKMRANNIDTVLVAKQVGQRPVEGTMGPGAGPFYGTAPVLPREWGGFYGPNYSVPGSAYEPPPGPDPRMGQPYPPTYGGPYVPYAPYAPYSPYRVFKLEATLYDAETERAVWSAMFDMTTAAEAFDYEIKSFVGTVMKKLVEAKLIT